ncbi:MAG: efflux RND transporter periplasmic adaptor subunit, partial [Fusobacteriaceae bacterium]
MLNKKYFQILGVGAILITLASCGKKEKIEERVSNVRVLEISKSSNEDIKVFSGVVTPQKENIIAFKVSGKIEKIVAKEGMALKKGDIIAQLEKDDYNLNLGVYTKKYEGALENYRAHSAIAENAELQFQRVERLYKEKATTKKLYDEVNSKYRAAISSKNGTMALMEEAKKGVENSKNRLNDVFLRAPYDGYVGTGLLEEGSIVNAGTPVFSFFSKGLSQVGIAVSENEIAILEKAETIKFSHLEKEYTLKVKEIGKKPDFSKLSYPVKLEFVENNDILSGAQGKVMVTLKKESSDEVKIPLSAIFENNGTKVWIYKDGKAVSKIVQIEKMAEDGMVVLKGGLNYGDKIVTAGVNFLHEDEKIKIVSEFRDTNVGK